MMLHDLQHQILSFFLVGRAGVFNGREDGGILGNILQVGFQLHEIPFHPVDRRVNDGLHAVVLSMQYGLIRGI